MLLCGGGIDLVLDIGKALRVVDPSPKVISELDLRTKAANLVLLYLVSQLFGCYLLCILFRGEHTTPLDVVTNLRGYHPHTIPRAIKNPCIVLLALLELPLKILVEVTVLVHELERTLLIPQHEFHLCVVECRGEVRDLRAVEPCYLAHHIISETIESLPVEGSDLILHSSEITLGYRNLRVGPRCWLESIQEALQVERVRILTRPYELAHTLSKDQTQRLVEVSPRVTHQVCIR